MYLTDNANGLGTVFAAGGLCKRAQPKASDLRENEFFCLVLNRQREQLWYFLRKYKLAKLEYQSYNKGTF